MMRLPQQVEPVMRQVSMAQNRSGGMPSQAGCDALCGLLPAPFNGWCNSACRWV